MYTDKELWDWGLSPRLRGNPGLLHLVQHKGRSIPAPAGEPWLNTMKRN